MSHRSPMALANSFAGIIFDYGGVLVDHQSPADQARLADIAGIPTELFLELYWSERPSYDRDDLSAFEYWHTVAKRAGTLFTPSVIEELIECDTMTWMKFDEPMFDWVHHLRAGGKRVAILSNMPRDLGEALKAKTDRFSRFNYVTLSYEVRATKPEPAIYVNCLQGIGLPADQVLFLDDRIENVHGAERLGIRSIQFTSRDPILLRLNSVESHS